MNKTLIISLAALAALAGIIIWLLYPNKWEIANYPPKGMVVVAFGDSLVEGVGATDGGDFVSLLSGRAGLSIANLGKSGETTSSALERVPKVLERKPDVVIVLLGGNDAIRRISTKETEANLRQIITQLQTAGSVVILLGVRGGLLGDPYDGMYERVAESTGSAYVSDVLEGLFGNPRYMDDAIHPNNAGYAVIADCLYPVLIDILKGTR